VEKGMISEDLAASCTIDIIIDVAADVIREIRPFVTIEFVS